MVEHHEHDECKGPFCAEVEDGDGGEEVAPIDAPTVFKIEDLVQAVQLLLWVLLQLDEELLEGLEGQERVFGVFGMLSGSCIEDLLEFVYLDCLPEVLELRYLDLLDMVSFVMIVVRYLWLGVVERH